MWWYILMLGCLHLQSTTTSADAQPLQNWGLLPPRYENPSNEKTLRYRLQQFRLLDNSEEDSPLSDNTQDSDHRNLDDSVVNSYLYNPETKRAFTLLSQWHPFTTLGRNTASIREQNRQLLNDLDIETRAMMRPVGQPLRWG